MGKRSEFKAKYQTEWESDPSLHDWLEPVPDNEHFARCSICLITLPAHHAGLLKHSAKHLNTQNKLSSSILSGCKVEAQSSHDVSTSHASSGVSNNSHTSLAAGLPAVASVMGQPCDNRLRTVHSAGRLLGRTGSELELHCENDDDYSSNTTVSNTAAAAISSATVAVLQPESTVHSDAGTQATAKRPLDTDNELQSVPKRKYARRVLSASDICPPEYRIEWQQDQRLKDWIVEVPDDLTKARCKQCNCVLSARYNLLLRHAASNKHNKMTDTAAVCVDNETDGDSHNESSISKEKIEELLKCIKKEHVTTGAADEQLESEQEESNTDKHVTDGRKKRKSTRGIKWSQYKKAYRREWETNPMLQGWLAPVVGDRYKAACKYCSCILRAHFSDLRHHYLSAKHNKNAEWFTQGGGELPVYVSNSDTDIKSTDGTDIVPGRSVVRNNNHKKLSSCYVISKNAWARYRKRYRKQWETDPQFQGWIMPVPGDDTRARCRYCRILLRAHHNDLRSHARTTKHATNVAFGRPCDELTSPQVSAKLPGVKATALNRRKQLVSDRNVNTAETYASLDEQFALDRADDSLCSLKTLTNLSSFGWYSSPLPETTVILQNDLHLDENIAASLPQTPGVRFRVRKEPSSQGAELNAGPSKKSKDKVTSDKVEMSQFPSSMTEEISHDMLSHIARSVTLWEFLMLKVNRTRGSCERTKIADILTEFSELHRKVKTVSHQVLHTADNDCSDSTTDRRTLVLDSEELARCLGLHTGQYDINLSELNESTSIDCQPLIAPLKRRSKPQRANTSEYVGMAQFVSLEQLQTVDGDAVEHRYIIEPTDGSDQQYILDPEAIDSSGVVQGRIDPASSQLVLVSENGELVLQYDPKDYPQFSNFTVDDVKSLVGCSLVDSGNIDSVNGETIYIAEDSSAGTSGETCLRRVKLHAVN